MNDCCEKCRFSSSFGMGFRCLRRSPTISPKGNTVWPGVQSNDWCGEFEMREDVKPCMKCGKPSGADGMGVMENYVIVGRVCKACREKVKEEKPANPCVECGKGTEPYLGYVPFYSGSELKFIHQTCTNERFKRGEKIYR